MTAPVTVSLLTGFLGSGKTTLLKELLRAPELRDTAVLINEFGEVGLDHLLLEEVDEEVVLLKSGCICCTVRADLRDGLGRLLGRMRRGEVPPFARIVIETTGLADPVPVIASFSADPALRHQFRLGSVVTVIDAVNGLANLDSHVEAERQVAVADRIVVSKTDLAPAAVPALLARLAAINPGAALTCRSEGEPGQPQLLLEEAGPWRRAEAVPGHVHHGAIGTFCLTADAPLDWAVFGLWLSMLLHRHGASILRVKGLLQVRGVDRPVVIQGVQHLVHKPSHLDAWPEGRPSTRLVVIGRGLDPAALTRSFRAFCLAGGRVAA